VTRASAARVLLDRWLPAVVVTETFLLLAVWTWARCADPQVDFGREVYVPWRLAEGDVLYRDVHSVFGPLSPYFNAAAFRLLGTTIRSLSLVNLAVLAAIVVLMWMLLRRITTRLASTAGLVVFLCVFAFAHPVRAGSFNFVAPYRHELTHGALLSLLALLLASRHLESGHPALLAACGAALGALALTKVEPFAATCGGVAAMLVAADPRPRAWARPWVSSTESRWASCSGPSRGRLGVARDAGVRRSRRPRALAARGRRRGGLPPPGRLDVGALR
jgi:hypothetical protein